MICVCEGTEQVEKGKTWPLDLSANTGVGKQFLTLVLRLKELLIVLEALFFYFRRNKHGIYEGPGEPPKILIYYLENDVKKEYDFYYFFKGNMRKRKRLTEKKVEMILEPLIDKEFDSYEQLIETMKKEIF